MTDKKIIVVLCLILVVGLSLFNLVIFSSSSGHKTSGLSISAPDSSKSSQEDGITQLVVNVEDLGPSDNSHSSSGGVSATGSQTFGDSSIPDSDEEEALPSACVQNYGLSMSTIIFYYSNEAHSNMMKTIVESLQSEYTFYLTDSLWNNEFNSCFGTTGATPTFVCAGTGEKLVGEVPKSMLEGLAGRCS